VGGGWGFSSGATAVRQSYWWVGECCFCIPNPLKTLTTPPRERGAILLPADSCERRLDGDGTLADPARRRSTCACSRHGQDGCLAGRGASCCRAPQAGPAQRGHLRWPRRPLISLTECVCLQCAVARLGRHVGATGHVRAACCAPATLGMRQE
jgi:hypothetical protein